MVWGFQATTTTAWGTPAFVAPHLTGQLKEIEQADGSKIQRGTGWNRSGKLGTS